MRSTILVFGGNSDVAKALSKIRGDTVLVSREGVDVRDYSKVSIIMQNVKPTAVVNCAAIINDVALAKYSLEVIREEVDINLIGSFNIAAAAIMNCVDTVVLIASMAGIEGRKNMSAYCATKAGVISLVESAAEEGHDFYCVSPSRIDTKMDKARVAAGKVKKLAKKDILSPRVVANAINQCLNGLYARGSNIKVCQKVAK